MNRVPTLVLCVVIALTFCFAVTRTHAQAGEADIQARPAATTKTFLFITVPHPINRPTKMRSPVHL